MFCSAWRLSNRYAIDRTIVSLFDVESQIFVTMATRATLGRLTSYYAYRKMIAAKMLFDRLFGGTKNTGPHGYMSAPGSVKKCQTTVTTCWQLDFHVLTDDRPASSNSGLQGGCSAHARFRWVFLATKHCRLDADNIKQ